MNVKEYGFLWTLGQAMRDIFIGRTPGDTFATAITGLPARSCCANPDPKFKHGALYCFRCNAPLE